MLIETTGAAGAAALSDFEGRHLRIGHGVSCSISEVGVEVGRGRFSVVTFVDSDDLLRDRFFDAAETLLRSLGETPATEELRRVVAELIELFRLASQPPRGTVQGLWAELWIVAQAREPEVLLDAWHAEPTDAYDFNSGPERLEVKSTSQRTRRHTFSHRQLEPPTGTRVAIASVFVESSGGGPTVSTLVERIRRESPNRERWEDSTMSSPAPWELIGARVLKRPSTLSLRQSRCASTQLRLFRLSLRIFHPGSPMSGTCQISPGRKP